MASIDMRGRYMIIYGFSWGIASGISSPLGGFMSDTFGPHIIWYGAGFLGLLSVISFLFLGRVVRNRQPLVNLSR